MEREVSAVKLHNFCSRQLAAFVEWVQKISLFYVQYKIKHRKHNQLHSREGNGTESKQSFFFEIALAQYENELMLLTTVVSFSAAVDCKLIAISTR